MAEKKSEVVIRLAIKDAEKVEQALRKLGASGDAALRAMAEAATPASHGLQILSGFAEGARSEMEALSGRLGPLGGTLSALGPAGLIGGAAVAGIGAAAVSTVRSLADLKREAQTAGIDVGSFQRLRIVAIDTGVEIGALVDGIKELQLRTDEYVQTGGGPAAESFKRLGLTAGDLARALHDPAELLTTLIGRIEKLDQAARVRVLDEVFGGQAAERFLALVEQGEDGIREIIRAGEDAGRVIDTEMVERAAEVDRRFQKIADTVSQNVKGAIVSATFALGDLLDGLASAPKSIAKMTDEELAAVARPTEYVGGTRNKELVPKIIPPKITVGRAGEVDNPEYLRQQEAIEELRRRAEERERNSRFSDYERRRERERQSPLIHPEDAPLPTKKPNLLAMPEPQQQADAVREHIEALERELDLVDKSALAQRIAAEVRKLEEEATRQGTEATEAQRAAVAALVTAIDAKARATEDAKRREEEAIEATRRAADSARGLGRDFFGGLLSDLERGVDLFDALGDALDRFASRLLDMALDDVFDALFPDPSQAGAAPQSRLGGLVSYLFGDRPAPAGAAAGSAPTSATGAAPVAAVSAALRSDPVDFGRLVVPGASADTLRDGRSLNPAAAWRALKGMGYSDVHAAAALGNWRQESGLRLDAWNANEKAFGLEQWRGDRLDNLATVADRMKVSALDPRAQLAHFDAEIRGVVGTEGRFGRDFLAARDLEGANQALKRVIRYGDDSEGTRLGYAREYLARYGGQAAPPTVDPEAIQALQQLGGSARTSAEAVAGLGSGADDAAKVLADAFSPSDAVAKAAAPSPASAPAGGADPAASLGQLFQNLFQGIGGIFSSLIGLITSALGGGGAGGGLGGFLGAILGLFGASPKARGGRFQTGQPLLVGEEGPELIKPDFAGEVVTAPATERAIEEAERRRTMEPIPAVGLAGWRSLRSREVEREMTMAEDARKSFAMRRDYGLSGGDPFGGVGLKAMFPAAQTPVRPVFQTVVENNTGAKVETREEDDGMGGRRQRVVISEAVADALASPGPTRRTMASAFGTRPRITRR
ncbi:phage tail tip lysozyme [Oharaeibacter diazotrophicus]|uniref:Phage tail lysozyme domain-containing protein n=1 Tax=Oharaeibacter diazotrophicus TaxID=1920512 RepID=A0A4R6RGX8_9HYPH|nr:phage tail tip lysozyme [Oharaeibacter diazotrophicus]TDP85395.1 hypothetical protein EDD54_2248 [Oharaeibacter diazotrophicus]BBE74365.1 hypothetical protein OHA_1_03996 [Pleomorphomonas sp. SM30]GLS75942.1 hypothetical protein GCM10007904_12770 [Oharaeibacter diazotrophicus]